MFELFEEAKSKAPSYIVVKDDGAPLTCNCCGVRDRGSFVKLFTVSEGEIRGVTHMSCVDSEWLTRASNMGRI